MAGGRATGRRRCALRPRLHARESSTNVSSRVGPVTDTSEAQLGVPVALLVEPAVAADLLELEPLHGNGVIWASLDAQSAANAALLVEDHRGAVGPAVGVDELWQRALRLHLVDVDHVDDALGADIRARAAEHAAISVEPDVVVAHEAARALGHGLLRAVAHLDRRREVDLR